MQQKFLIYIPKRQELLLTLLFGNHMQHVLFLPRPLHQAADYEFQHILASPHFPQENGGPDC